MLSFKLETRPQASQLMSYLSPLLAVLLTMLGGLLVFTALGKDPLLGFQVFFLNPLRDGYALSELLLKATPLMLCAMGLAVGFRANVWNIGAEGQFIVGACAATGVRCCWMRPAARRCCWRWCWPEQLGGAAWAAIPAFLRTRFNANEILVSLMLVYIAQLLVSWLVFGPWIDPEGFNFPQTRMFADSALLPMLVEGTRLNYAFVLALGVLAVGYVFMHKSYLGFKMRVAGEAPDAARYAGYSAKLMIWIGLLVGGPLPAWPVWPRWPGPWAN